MKIHTTHKESSKHEINEKKKKEEKRKQFTVTISPFSNPKISFFGWVGGGWKGEMSRTGVYVRVKRR